MEKGEKYFEVLIEVKDLSLEKKEALKFKGMEEFECDGIEEYSLNIKEVHEHLGDQVLSGASPNIEKINKLDEKGSEGQEQEKYFFYGNGSEERAKKFHQFLTNTEMLNATLSEKNWTDWNEEWRKHFKEIKISNSFRVLPSWEKENHQEGPDKIFIYPGMGFGTGGHETTFLCLQQFLDLKDKLKGSKALDMGCGSGILGIAALKFLDWTFDFCDVDRDALDNCKENLELNFPVEKLNGNRLVSRERFNREEEYGLIFANILKNILYEEKRLLVDQLSNDGYLILSGILNEQASEVKDTFSNEGLKFIEQKDLGAWSSLLFRKS